MRGSLPLLPSRRESTRPVSPSAWTARQPRSWLSGCPPARAWGIAVAIRPPSDRLRMSGVRRPARGEPVEPPWRAVAPVEGNAAPWIAAEPALSAAEWAATTVVSIRPPFDMLRVSGETPALRHSRAVHEPPLRVIVGGTSVPHPTDMTIFPKTPRLFSRSCARRASVQGRTSCTIVRSVPSSNHEIICCQPACSASS